MALSCIFTKRNEAGTYFVRGNERLEDTVEFGRAHVPVVFSIVPQDFVKRRVRVVDIVVEVFELRCSLAEERPHLLAVPVVLLDIREVVRELLPDPLQALAQLSQALADILEIDCRSDANHREFDHIRVDAQ